MAKYLVKTTEVYRVDTEAEAQSFIEEAKRDSTSTLVKYSSEQKTTKKAGEILDEWQRVTLVREFNLEKEPDSVIDIAYNKRGFNLQSIPKAVSVGNVAFDEEGEDAPW